jgi:hypothetical protein
VSLVRSGWVVLALLTTIYGTVCVVLAGFEIAFEMGQPFSQTLAYRHALAAVLTILTVAILDVNVIVGLLRRSRAMLIASWWWLFAALILGALAVLL